jgi:hypothetical protein
MLLNKVCIILIKIRFIYFGGGGVFYIFFKIRVPLTSSCLRSKQVTFHSYLEIIHSFIKQLCCSRLKYFVSLLLIGLFKCDLCGVNTHLILIRWWMYWSTNWIKNLQKVFLKNMSYSNKKCYFTRVNKSWNEIIFHFFNYKQLRFHFFPFQLIAV